MDQETLQAIQAAVSGAVSAMLPQQGDPRARFKHDIPNLTTPTTNLMHGPGGIFGAAGLERDVFSTRIKPRGLMSVLPAHPSVDMNPVVPYLTGITADASSSEKSAVCDPPIVAGNLKSCFQGSAFGRVERKTAPLELNQIGQRVNRGEFYDLRIVNDPLLNDSFGMPSVPLNFQQVLAREVLARFLTVGASFENSLGTMVWAGNPANNTLGGGYMEFNGLQRLITTGIRDILTNALCPSLDSDVKNFNYLPLETNANAIFAALTMIYRFVRHNAIGMGFMPVQWAWVMREELFNQLVDVWPCAYNTYQCTTASASNPNFTDGAAMKAMADEMRAGLTLKIDGVTLPVIIDDFIPEQTNVNNGNVPAGNWASDIYLLPLTVIGGREVTYFEHFDYDQANGVLDAIADGRLGPSTYTSDGGRFLWTTEQTLWCFDWAAKIEPRLRLLTPHLAGRLQNVMYHPLQHFRTPQPGSAYFANGGNTSGSWNPYYGG